MVQLTSKSLHNRQPAWSRDGKLIAFVSDRGGTNDVWIMNADGSAQKRLTTLAGEEDHPSFSPAGDRIVFSETANNAATLMSVKVDGSDLQPLTTGGFKDWNPSWSRQGILFPSNRDGSGHWKIWQVQADGSGLSQVGNSIGLDPVRLPDGRIVFTDETNGFAALAAIMVLDPISGTKTRVTTVDGFFITIDIRRKRINPKSRGVVPVAILSTKTFNATTQVDRSSITFGATGNEKSLVRCNSDDEKEDADGAKALVCFFRIRKAGFHKGDTVGILRARTTEGLPLEGRDSVVIVTEEEDDD